ncbi:MAG: class I SAM-dependent methyltransferase [Chloroflexota bacterium]|nr:MAG: class I SAM-dependent methyltransferase [Chloroflexota bacterium]
MAKQDDVFLADEGDAWFKRNRSYLVETTSTKTDYPLALIAQYNLHPKKVLEVGCSNGWRLDAIRRRYDCTCVGIEPSEAAALAGRERFPGLDLRIGLASRLPCPPDESFDLVIVNFVLHWVDRKTLLVSLAEIDRTVADGGYLILGDFLPDWPKRNRYHHRDDVELYTYKLDYAAILQSTALYTNVARITFDHDQHALSGDVGSYERGVCQLLRKSTSEFYQL